MSALMAGLQSNFIQRVLSASAHIDLSNLGQTLFSKNGASNTDGLQQFNLQTPAGVTAGAAVPIVLTVNGTPTQTTATVSLK